MAKKFGKLLLFSAAVGAVVGSAYYYYQNKDKILKKDLPTDDEDEDFDDFSEDLDEDSRNYVDLELEKVAEQKEADACEENACEEKAPEKSLEEIKSEISQKATVVAEKVLEKSADALSAAAGKISETAKALDHVISQQANQTTEEFFDDDEETEVEVEE